MGHIFHTISDGLYILYIIPTYIKIQNTYLVIKKINKITHLKICEYM